jgi:hypothetical protein
LGALLLEGGHPSDAETVYLKDRQRFRENGWSLFGLVQSLEAQGRQRDAAAARSRFERASGARGCRSQEATAQGLMRCATTSRSKSAPLGQ